MDIYVDDLVEFFEVLDLKDVVMIGYLMGGGEVVCFIGWYGI